MIKKILILLSFIGIGACSSAHQEITPRCYVNRPINTNRYCFSYSTQTSTSVFLACYSGQGACSTAELSVRELNGHLVIGPCIPYHLVPGRTGTPQTISACIGE